MVTTRGGGRSTLTTGTSAGSPGVMLALATVGFLVQLLGLGTAQPAGPAVQGGAGAQRRSSRRCWSRSPSWSVARPHPGRRADRPVRRPGDVPAGVLRRRSSRCCSSATSATTRSRRSSSAGSSSASAGRRSRSASRSSAPGSRRTAGPAIGIFGAGMGGTAISALTTVRLVDRYGLDAVPGSPRSCSRRTACWPRSHA